MSVTLLDIARIAQVSESAVSRALHDHPRISVATRERIKKIAAELEFDFNSQARALSTSKSGTVGIILPNYGTDVRRTYYLDLLVNDIRAQLGASHYDLLIAETGRAETNQSNLRRLVLQRKVDGLVLIIGDLADADRQVLTKRKIPVVMVNSKPLELVDQSLDEFPSYFTDNLEGGRLAARHLIDRGSRRLVCLADERGGPEMVDRTLGFGQGASLAGLNPQILACGSDFDSTYTFARHNLAHLRGAGVFCHTDVMACAVLRAAQDQGIRVPADLKVVGYDDIELGTYFAPRLTTLHQPRETIAQMACDFLTARLAGAAPRPVAHVCVPPTLVVRGST